MSDDTFFVENKNLQHQLQENKNVRHLAIGLILIVLFAIFFLALSYN